MSEHKPPSEWTAVRAFILRHKIALIVGAFLLLIVAGTDRSMDEAGSVRPATDFDQDTWDEQQRGEDRMQRDRIDGIREVERCIDEDGRVYEVPIGTCT